MLKESHLAAGLHIEELHYFVAVDYGLQQSLVVALLQVGKLYAYHTKVFGKLLLAHLVLRRDVSLTERHKVVDVVAGIVHQSADGRICHLLISYCDGTHVQVYHLLHILHLSIHGQFHTSENARYHLGAKIIMIVERPSYGGFPAL